MAKSRDIPEIPEQYLPIVDEFLPEFLEMFAERSSDYGETYRFLGSKGQFSDINRKFYKLKRAIWDGEELKGEQVDEILNDIIAHCFLMKLCQREGI